MSLKFLTAFVLLAVASAIEIQHAPLIKTYTAPALIKSPIVKHIEYEAPAEYEFSYSVHDPHTGDIKSQKESRKGDKVEGSYELIDPDGHRRIVQYTADHHTGFNAIVHREPTDIKIPIPEPKKIIAQPIHKFIAAPVVHYSHAPAHVVHYSHAPAHVAPIAKILAPAHHGGGATHVSFSAPSVSYHY